MRRLRRQIWPPPTVYIAVIVSRADLKASYICVLNGSVLLNCTSMAANSASAQFPFPADRPAAPSTAYCCLPSGILKSGYTSKYAVRPSDEKWAKPRYIERLSSPYTARHTRSRPSFKKCMQRRLLLGWHLS